MKKKTLAMQYRTIPGFSNYKINRNGTVVINKLTERELKIQYVPGRTHWSGRISLVDNDGVRKAVNILALVMSTYGIKREETARKALLTV